MSAIGSAQPTSRESVARAVAAGGKRPRKKFGQKSPPQSGYHPFAFLKELEAGKVLTAEQLAQAARALTALEIRPQLHGYKQLANQLTNERETEAKGLSALGTRLQGGVTDVYKNIAGSAANQLATQSALAQRLTQQSGSIAAQSADSLKGMQEGQVGDFTKALELRGAPSGGSAQQELAKVVAGQQAQQSAASQSAQQAAVQQGGGYAGLLAAMAGATQMQGGAAVGGIGRDVLARTAASNQKYDEGIQQALGKLADVKATKGSTFAKNLLELRGGEQKFLLGKAAVQGEKESRAQEQAQFESELPIKEQQANASSTSAKASLINAVTSKWEAEHPNASNSEAAQARKEFKQEVGEVRSLIPGLVSTYGAPSNPKQLNQFIYALNSKASADPQLVAKVVKRWWSKRGKKLSRDPNGKSQGR